MQLYTVHERDTAEDKDPDVVLVKDKFCWPAFLFPLTLVWLVYRRLWLVLAGFVAAAAAIGALLALSGIGDGTAALLWILLFTWFGAEANSLRRWTLRRRGYRLVDVVAAEDQLQAESRYFREKEAASPPSLTGAAHP